MRAFEASQDDELEEVDIEEEVVKGVTIDMLERVVERLLEGTAYCVRDGTLFITEMPNNAHCFVQLALGGVF